jgi:hypothetical protein
LAGEGCRNDFVIFDLLDAPETFSEIFLDQAHAVLLDERKDDALILCLSRLPLNSFDLK